MKIVFTVSNDLNSDQRMIRTCTVLQDAGHQVLLIGRLRKESQPLIQRSFQQKRLPCWSQKGKLFYIEYNIRLFFFLLFYSSDVLGTVDLDTALPAWAIKPFKKWYWVIDAHEWFPHVPEVARRPRIQQFWLWVEGLVIPRADRVYTVGKAIANELQKAYNRPVLVVRNAPFLKDDLPNIDPKIQKQLPLEPFILYQGALNEGRGLERLLQILALNSFHLVVAGDGDILLKLKQEVVQLGIQKRVHFLGFVPPSELPALTQRARLGYNVSEPVSKSYELSLNNKFFDYVHAGLPSIINDFVEYRSLCEEFPVGLLVPNENADILNALNLLMNNDDEHAACVKACIEAKNAWNWQIESQQLLEIYTIRHV